MLILRWGPKWAGLRQLTKDVVYLIILQGTKCGSNYRLLLLFYWTLYIYLSSAWLQKFKIKLFISPSQLFQIEQAFHRLDLRQKMQREILILQCITECGPLSAADVAAAAADCPSSCSAATYILLLLLLLQLQCRLPSCCFFCCGLWKWFNTIRL